MTTNSYDLLIIGGGPAGVSAGVYAARKLLKTLFVTEDFGGQSIVSEGIENWIGTVKISGQELADSLEKHLKAYAKDTVEIKTGSRITKIEKHPDYTAEAPLFNCQISESANSSTSTVTTKSILIATGSGRRKLPAKDAEQFEHKGLTYCATCDGPVFSGQDVIVVGGGNAAFESVAQLSAYCKSVTLINRREEFRADPITVEKVLAKPNVKVLTPVDILEVNGSQFVESINYYNSKTKETGMLTTGGIFVEIGMIPNTEFAKDILTLDSSGKIIVDSKNQRTQTPGIWSAGDCTDGLYHQNNIAAGDAVKALEDIYMAIHKR